MGRWGPRRCAKHYLCYSTRYICSYSKHIVSSSFPSGRCTRAAFSHSHLCTLFLEHLCTPCLEHLFALRLQNLCALSLGIVAHFLSLGHCLLRTLPCVYVAHFTLGLCCALYLGSLRTSPWTSSRMPPLHRLLLGCVEGPMRSHAAPCGPMRPK